MSGAKGGRAIFATTSSISRGSLNNEQKQLIVAQSQRFVPDDQSWADYRAALRRGDDGAGTRAALVRRVFARVSRHDVRARALVWRRILGSARSNQDLYRDVIARAARLADGRTTASVVEDLQDLAKDFDELALDAPAAAPACRVPDQLLEREKNARRVPGERGRVGRGARQDLADRCGRRAAASRRCRRRSRSWSRSTAATTAPMRTHVTSTSSQRAMPAHSPAIRPLR